jgi:hypothetical protein
MVLFINATICGLECRHLGYPIPDHESAFELLTLLVADGWIVQEAFVVDGPDRLKVPVEAFDGQPIQIHIHSLQRQWQRLLSDQPIPPNTLNNQQLKSWYMQLDAYYAELIEHLDKIISLVELRKDRLATYPNKLLCLQLVTYYNVLLTSNRRMRNQTRKSRQTNKNRLGKLKTDR